MKWIITNKGEDSNSKSRLVAAGYVCSLLSRG